MVDSGLSPGAALATQGLVVPPDTHAVIGNGMALASTLACVSVAIVASKYFI